MTGANDFLVVIEAIRAAGLDAELWPKALAGMTGIVGGNAATLEVIEKQPLRQQAFYAYGVPPLPEMAYFDQYVTLNRRLPVVARASFGEASFDYCVFDEQTIQHDPLYNDLLATYDLSCFVSGVIATNRQEFATVCVYRSPTQGHVNKAGAAMMERFLPHLQGAFDVARRLRSAGETRHALERALDWLADGVVLMHADGAVLHANQAFEVIGRGGDGLGVRKGMLQFLSSEARGRFEAILKGLQRQRSSDPPDSGADFSVARPSGAPPYLVSVRPLADHHDSATAIDAIVFVRDPLSRNGASIPLLREVFGLTDAEASLAQALQAGIALGDYAESRAVSLNTVYTHLRRLKDKTRCNRSVELIRKLNDLQVPLRFDCSPP